MSRKKKKLRVQFRKKAQRKARPQGLTRQLLDQGLESDHLVAGERLSGKGDLTRHRTIIASGEHGDQVVREVDESSCLGGRVLSAVGLTYHIQAADGRHFECTVRRVLRKFATDERNVVVTGDEVLFLPTGETEGVIERVEPRHGILARGSGGKAHILVANVDQVLIVASAADPQLKPALIDRFLISSEKGGVHSVICINKCDLIDRAALQPIIGTYSQLGYDVVLTSAARGDGIERLRSLLRGRETVLAGQSGVGKSSLLNAIQPGLSLATSEVSGWTRKGKHTTRRAQLHELNFGGWVVDTPGIRQLALWDLIREEIEGYFVEFRPFVTLCKYPNCLHVRESGCGVRMAVERDLIAPVRYASYLRIVTGDQT